MNEKTLVFFKPNITKNRQSARACRLFFGDMKFVKTYGFDRIPVEFFREFYKHVREPDLTRHSTFCSSGPILLMIFEGENVIERVRIINGATNSSKARSDSLRGYFYQKYRPENVYDNFVHSSENASAFEREWQLFLEYILQNKILPMQ